MKQRTIAKRVELVGIGLHKGVPVNLALEPLPADSGLVIYRSDLGVSVPLRPENVIDTTMATVIGSQKAKISTIEHLLSAVHAYGIDNLRIVLDNEEAPIMDGSSIGFCMLIDEAGIKELDKPKKILSIKKAVEVRDKDKFVRVEPSDSITFDFTIRFPHPSIKEQHYKFNYSLQAYKEEIARARTFGFLQEVQQLRAMGLGLGGNFSNCIVLDENGILNKEGLRFKDEFVRHKILDAIGDMALLGMPLVGSYISFAGSHKLNHFLTEKILSDASSYEIIDLEDRVEDKALQTSFSYASN
ncbi:UDP-3-O-[3-hydroxymyristoyl] N-acetylglucosamine deacetylase [Helicobacter sp. 13S00401-1]|uniref:UDP-3-O-acyl-N-acetylglucosamine deacetylase n=1 Tax=Helicobacter sp. 13S00401-1 TaxID=1905758 RepID=UPI000BA77DA9|nr:UDP-3-O-acyl-N-acetylglucosamine deacetylase [Helicobacter sp. 13S00401-1]PAF49713.1 UDP-3-O-[3-hydroxymyristoyl] N-acetylglucosamine deacetylase [Helicobacter sp. 13S00401-1]